MTTEQPNVNPLGLYGRKETMSVLGIGSTTLYNWSDSGILPCHVRKSNGRKVWKGADIIKAWNLIY